MALDKLVELATTLHAQGNAKEALATYQRNLEIEPGHIGVLNNLAALYRQQGNKSGAETCYRRALDFRPDSLMTIYNLEFFHASEQCFDEALELFGRALELDPGSHEAVAAKAGILEQQRKTGEACNCLLPITE